MAIEVYCAAYAQAYMAMGNIEWDEYKLKFALLASTWAPTLQTVNGLQLFEANEWGDVSAHEVAAGSGYTAGGCDLTGGPDNQLTGYPQRNGATTHLRAMPARWTNLTKTFRYGMLYVDGTHDSIVKPLIAAYLFDNTPADVTVTASNLTLRWHRDGVWMMR